MAALRVMMVVNAAMAPHAAADGVKKLGGAGGFACHAACGRFLDLN